MRYKVIRNNGGMLIFIPERYKDPNMYDKAVDPHPFSHALRSVPDCCKTHKMCN